VSIVSLFLVKKIYSVSEIEVKGGQIKDTNVLLGKLIFFIDTDKAEKELVLKNPDVKDVVIQKVYPSKISISVRKESPVAVLIAKDGFFYLSSKGKVLLKQTSMEDRKPLIHSFEKIYMTSYSAGDYINTLDIQYSLYFITKMKDLGIFIQSVDILGFDVLVLNEAERSYLVSIARDREIQYTQLKEIVNHFVIEGREYKSLDLRFEKPIIKLK
jgi:hypothetical protein